MKEKTYLMKVIEIYALYGFVKTSKICWRYFKSL